jgi:hypothetical protein
MSLIATLRAWRDRRAERRREQREVEALRWTSPGAASEANIDNRYRNAGPGGAGGS